MIPERIQALFAFIDYLDSNKQEYIEKYIPLCDEINALANKRSQLKRDKNYKDKLEYDAVQAAISEKFQPITENIYKPVTNKLLELGIWSGDDPHSSIWNNNFSAISDYKTNFSSEDIPTILVYKRKYLDFRNETNSYFLSLQFILEDLDEVLKQLFDFFKDTEENEFDKFETKTVEVESIEEAIKGFVENKGKNVKYSIPHDSAFRKTGNQQQQSPLTTINNHFNMGDIINVGDIRGNSGPVIIGKDIRISDSFNERKETADKIAELIEMIKKEQNINEQQLELLISSFDMVKAELLVEKPVKSKIFTWLSDTKVALENLVLTHHVTEAIHWVYNNLNFIAHQL